LQTDQEKEDFRRMLFQSGNLDVTELNTGGRGLKIAPVTGIASNVPIVLGSGADNKLMARIGGEKVLKQIKGLERYTYIDTLGE
jgi:hypothetical protein